MHNNPMGGAWSSIHGNKYATRFGNRAFSARGGPGTQMFSPRNNMGRLGVGGGAALLAFSHGRKALESMRYGEIGHTLIHAGIAGGAGYLGYHALTNSSTFRVGAGKLSQAILSKNSAGNAGWMGKMVKSFANSIGRMA